MDIESLSGFLSFIFANKLGFGRKPYRPESFKPGSVPDGFRGVKWGTPKSALPDMKPVYTEPDPSKPETYVKINEDLKINGVELESIRYVFSESKGGFCTANVWLKGGYEDFAVLRRTFRERYGLGLETTDEEGESYMWFNTEVMMSLWYKKDTAKAGFVMSSLEHM